MPYVETIELPHNLPGAWHSHSRQVQVPRALQICPPLCSSPNYRRVCRHLRSIVLYPDNLQGPISVAKAALATVGDVYAGNWGWCLQTILRIAFVLVVCFGCLPARLHDRIVQGNGMCEDSSKGNYNVPPM